MAGSKIREWYTLNMCSEFFMVRKEPSWHVFRSRMYRTIMNLEPFCCFMLTVRFANLMKRRQIRDALGSEREALLSQLTEQMVSLHHSNNTRATVH